jgi:hypothetical protein
MLTKPIHEIFLETLRIRFVADKILALAYAKHPSLKGHICHNKGQKTVALVVAWAVLLAICLMTGTSINPLVLYNSIPFLGMNDFMTQTAQAEHSGTAYCFMLVWVIALDTGIVMLFRRYITGDDDVRFLSVNRILKWVLNLYLCAVIGSLTTPVAVWYAFHASDASGWAKYLSAPGTLAVISVLLFSAFFVDSLQNIGAIYFSVLFFKLTSALQISYVFAFIVESVKYLSHISTIDSLQGMSLCFMVVMQMVLDYIRRFQLYEKFVKLLRFLVTTIAGLICLTICLGLVIAVYVCIRRW